MSEVSLPTQTGLYDPRFEHDACGIGVVADIKGNRRYGILRSALSVLKNLEHRGGAGLESNTGDGAGILFQIPHRFFRVDAQRFGHLLPDEGEYGVAMVFLPQDKELADQARALFEESVAQAGMSFLFWREVPTEPRGLGQLALSCMPTIYQAFILRPTNVAAGEAFERKLYVTRRIMENRIEADKRFTDQIYYICSMSCRTIVYKGMLVAPQLEEFYCDLRESTVETSMALVHSRFSTNTDPSWERAHPNRYLIHNGEINTLRSNVNWVRAREPRLYSAKLGADMERIKPIVSKEGSDSAVLDNVFEFLTQSGRSMARVATMLIPEPWDKNPSLPKRRRSFMSYQSMLTEPWDGPSAIAFTDGVYTGAALDRNGLRPGRYTLTKDGLFVLASETGVLDIDDADVLLKGSMKPGDVLLVDPHKARVIWGDELKDGFAAEQPYREWIDSRRLKIDDLDMPDTYDDPAEDIVKKGEPALTCDLLKYGYRAEDLNDIIFPMAENGAEPYGSMGADNPLSILSERPKRLFSYFRQQFAQVTNPPIDAEREKFVTSTRVYLGQRINMVEDHRDNCRRLKLDTPLINSQDYGRIVAVNKVGFKTAVLRSVYDHEAGEGALESALADLAVAADKAVADGKTILVICDAVEAVNEVPIPSLMAVSHVHHHLIDEGVRTRCDILVATGDAFETHDMATLIGYGASAIYPYAAHAVLRTAAHSDNAPAGDVDELIANYNKAATDGIIRIMSKMGISTIQSYTASQIFEAVGISKEVIDTYFASTVSRVSGLSIEGIQAECDARFEMSITCNTKTLSELPAEGEGDWRTKEESHRIDGDTLKLLRRAVRDNDFEAYMKYSSYMDTKLSSLRDLLGFDRGRMPISVDQVESVESIVTRFKTGAMSYGSISEEAHTTLAIGMNRLHARSNCGEGGEDVSREVVDANGDSRLSAIKQVASGRFGVTSRYLNSGLELQIKMAQGAKPGEGGHLPGKKVYPWIAATRRSTPGVPLISPPPHHDIYSIEDLAELVYDLKNANDRADIAVKLVAEAGVGTIAAGVAKSGADKIAISGCDGGTGAAAKSSIYHAGLPFEMGLAETQQVLVRNGLRSRVTVEADGKLMTGRDVVVACLLGAEEFAFATAPLVAMGCIMCRQCHMDNCPAGLATQDLKARSRFKGTPENIVTYMTFVATEVRNLMAELGFKSITDMVGHVDCLVRRRRGGWKADLVDMSPILARPLSIFSEIPGAELTHFDQSMAFDHKLENVLDSTLFVPLTEQAIERASNVRFHVDISNVNRCVGTLLGSRVTRQHPEGLPDRSIVIDCEGSGGQSFGAFLPSGVEFSIEGDANDYFGKGLSGGLLSVHPPKVSTFNAEENMIIGNVAFFGATGGSGYINGLAGQRFAARNSGADLVVEGIGNHGCEYMTGGTVLILGSVGMNFAAGMSGGVAYVFDRNRLLAQNVNQDMIEVATPSPSDLERIRNLIAVHVKKTDSALGIKMLYRFEDVKNDFVKIVPRDYKRVMDLVDEFESKGLSVEEAQEMAFEEFISEKQ